MDIEIVKIQRKGKENQEFIKLTVNKACNLKYFLIADTTYLSSDSISNKLRHMYWFSPQEVNQGDTIYLYTGVGTNSHKVNSDKTTTYIFYWNLNIGVWNDDKDAAILFNINTWTTTKSTA